MESILSMPLDERLEYFELQQFDTETTSYFKEFSAEEIAQLEKEYIEVSKKLDELNTEMKSKIAHYQGLIKKETSTQSYLMSNLRTRGEHRSGIFYKVPDHDNNKMLFFDEDGNFKYDRQMDPHEKLRRLDFTGSNKPEPLGSLQQELDTPKQSPEEEKPSKAKSSAKLKAAKKDLDNDGVIDPNVTMEKEPINFVDEAEEDPQVFADSNFENPLLGNDFEDEGFENTKPNAGRRPANNSSETPDEL